MGGGLSNRQKLGPVGVFDFPDPNRRPRCPARPPHAFNFFYFLFLGVEGLLEERCMSELRVVLKMVLGVWISLKIHQGFSVLKMASL